MFAGGLMATRITARPNGWVDLVARGFVGLWAGTVVGMVVVVAMGLVLVSSDPRPGFEGEGIAVLLFGAYAVCIPLTAIWFLLDLPRPWRRRSAKRAALRR